jgi:MFS family permease
MEYPSQSDNDDEKRKEKGKEKRHYLDYGAISTNYRDQRPSKSRRERFENKYVISTMVVYFNVLAGDMTRGILFPTLWLYVASLGGSKSFQGIVVSAYSCGRILAAPLFGYLSEKFDHQSVMILCNLIIIMGTLIYSIGKVLWIIPLGNFFIGMGAAR